MCQKNFPSYCEILSFNISMQGANTLSNLTKKEILVSQIRRSELINLKLNMDINQVSNGYQTRIGIASLLRLSLIPTKHDTSKVLKPAIILQDDFSFFDITNCPVSVLVLIWIFTIIGPIPLSLLTDLVQSSLTHLRLPLAETVALLGMLSNSDTSPKYWVSLSTLISSGSLTEKSDTTASLEKKIFVKMRIANFMKN